MSSKYFINAYIYILLQNLTYFNVKSFEVLKNQTIDIICSISIVYKLSYNLSNLLKFYQMNY